ncbi:MAG: cyclodeaminase/cyclohydrolase family protein, partial [Muribaculaceae bacterium]|nr:cyclodeaminase/cyclohydrolase family protein [Muribaculaceae bacterium]
VDMKFKDFAEETASEWEAYVGGSISAYMCALAASLGTMVANLSAHKPGWDARWEEFGRQAEEGQRHLKTLLALVDEDTEAFNRIMDAFKMPKGTDAEKAARTQAIQDATLYATQVPLRTMEAASAVFPLLLSMASTGNPASVSDAGVGALAARSAVLGAWLNVRINAAGLKDCAEADGLLERAASLAEQARQFEEAILKEVEAKL